MYKQHPYTHISSPKHSEVAERDAATHQYALASHDEPVSRLCELRRRRSSRAEQTTRPPKQANGSVLLPVARTNVVFEGHIPHQSAHQLERGGRKRQKANQERQTHDRYQSIKTCNQISWKQKTKETKRLIWTTDRHPKSREHIPHIFVYFVCVCVSVGVFVVIWHVKWLSLTRSQHRDRLTFIRCDELDTVSSY